MISVPFFSLKMNLGSYNLCSCKQNYLKSENNFYMSQNFYLSGGLTLLDSEDADLDLFIKYFA